MLEDSPGLSEGPARPPQALEPTLERAHRLGEGGDWAGMAELLRGALEDHPGDPFVLCWLGVAEREMGLDGVAYDRFKACLAAHPRDPHVLTTAGAGLARFDDPDAEPALRTAAMLAPDVAEARLAYGAFLAREGQTDAALEELRAARAGAPDNPAVPYETGVALALAGHHEAAARELARSLELAPGEPWTRLVLGLVLLEEARFEAAHPELIGAAEGLPDDVEAQLLAALSAAIQGDDDRAWVHLERARQRALPEDAQVTETVEERLGDPERARELLRAELQPGILRRRLSVRP